MFGCIAAQAHIIVVVAHPQTMLNSVRLELDDSESPLCSDIMGDLGLCEMVDEEE
jgi:hypothetical protein